MIVEDLELQGVRRRDPLNNAISLTLDIADHRNSIEKLEIEISIEQTMDLIRKGIKVREALLELRALEREQLMLEAKWNRPLIREKRINRGLIEKIETLLMIKEQLAAGRSPSQIIVNDKHERADWYMSRIKRWDRDVKQLMPLISEIQNSYKRRTSHEN